MLNMPIREYLCNECPHMHYHNSITPRKVKGILLQAGDRYCTGGSRLRKYGKRDPAMRVPKWCPRRLSPCILRIYHYKSVEAEMLSFLISGQFPCEKDYAVKHEGSLSMTAREFVREVNGKGLYEVLGFTVISNEIIEVDDGLKPYTFLVGPNKNLTSIFFSGQAARSVP